MSYSAFLSLGDRDYKISFLSSGEVTATTLCLPSFKEVFPRDFETILTTVDGTLSYQIRTVIQEQLDYRLDDIDSPEWLAVPTPTWSYRNHHSLKVHCKVFVPNENPQVTNELNMYRAILAPRKPVKKSKSKSRSSPSGRRHSKSQLAKTAAALSQPQPQFDFQTVVGIHKETQNHAEENGPTILQGMRIPLKYGHVIYELKLRTTNASDSFEGIYQCALEREWDKLYVSSVITLFGNQSPLPGIPRAQLISCEPLNFDREKMVIIFNQGQETCIRCRGIGYPQPEVGIYHDERELTNDGSWDVGVTKYINVRDAGISEATYIFWKPHQKHAGTYSCRAFNDNGSTYVYFTIYI